MVDPYDELIDTYYKKELEQTRAEWAAKEAEDRKKRDQQYAPLLAAIREALKFNLQSFSDLPYIPARVIEDRMIEFVDVLNRAGQKWARDYALNCLFHHGSDITDNDLSFDALYVMYVRLVPDSPEISESRSVIANRLNEALTTKDFERFIALFDKKEDSADRSILLLGLIKIKDKKLEDQIVKILQEELRERDDVRFVAEVAKKRKLPALIPQLEEAMPNIQNNEVKRYVEKAIESLKKFKKKQSK